MSIESPAGLAGMIAAGRAVETEVRCRGFHVLRELTGHGTGRTMWEPPSVPVWAS